MNSVVPSLSPRRHLKPTPGYDEDPWEAARIRVWSRLGPMHRGAQLGLRFLVGPNERWNDLNKALWEYLVILIALKFKYLKNIEGYGLY